MDILLRHSGREKGKTERRRVVVVSSSSSCSHLLLEGPLLVHDEASHQVLTLRSVGRGCSGQEVGRDYSRWQRDHSRGTILDDLSSRYSAVQYSIVQERRREEKNGMDDVVVTCHDLS